MPQEWANFAVITGGAAGALTGLLFVAVSLNSQRISRHAGLRAQAGQTLVLFSLLVVLVFLVVGSCLQLAGDDGLYWAAASSAMSLIGGVASAWLFLTRPLDRDTSPA